jgi:hypothetical protein
VGSTAAAASFALAAAQRQQRQRRLLVGGSAAEAGSKAAARAKQRRAARRQRPAWPWQQPGISRGDLKLIAKILRPKPQLIAIAASKISKIAMYFNCNPLIAINHYLL